jgi:hypothetical protein
MHSFGTDLAAPPGRSNHLRTQVKRWDRGEETAQGLSLRRTELPHGLRTRFLATFVEPVGPSLAATAPSIVTLSNVMSLLSSRACRRVAEPNGLPIAPQ